MVFILLRDTKSTNISISRSLSKDVGLSADIAQGSPLNYLRHIHIAILNAEAQSSTRKALPKQQDSLHHYMPHSSSIFTGQVAYLDQLEKYFKQKIDQPHHKKCFLLYGLGGIGKSQICMKFVEQSTEW